MATLTEAARKHVAQSRFGIPAAKGPEGGVHGRYPMPDAAHARNAKARAAARHNAGKLSDSQFGRINAMADRILGNK